MVMFTDAMFATERANKKATAVSSGGTEPQASYVRATTNDQETTERKHDHHRERWYPL